MSPPLRPLPIVGHWYFFAGYGPLKLHGLSEDGEACRVGGSDGGGSWLSLDSLVRAVTTEDFERFEEQSKARGLPTDWIAKAKAEVAAHEKEFADGR